jgi:hypothetical protein
MVKRHGTRIILWHRKAQTMRSKNNGSGRKILAKVAVPLGVDDITIYALRYLDGIGDNNCRETILSSNKREIFNFAKSAIHKWGTEEPKEYVEKKLNGSVKTIRKIVEYKFPECD